MKNRIEKKQAVSIATGDSGHENFRGGPYRKYEDGTA